jgi:hypothetical protein
MQDRILSLYKGFVLGDALGILFEGMSRGHIESHFKNFSGYPDILKALKNKTEQWRKPGLYGSLTQFACICALLNIERPYDYRHIRQFIYEKGRILEDMSGIFRKPSTALNRYLISAYNGKSNDIDFSESASLLAVTAASLVPAVVTASVDPVKIMLYAQSLGSDVHTCVGSALLIQLLTKAVYTEDADPIEFARYESSELKENIQNNSPLYFNAGFNPDALLLNIKVYEMIFSDLSDAKNYSDAETRIVNIVNKIMKSPVTRATIDHSCAILPYACALSSHRFVGEKRILYTAASMGGSSASLAAIAGMLTGAFYGDCFSDELVEQMINRRLLMNILEKISNCTGGRKDAEQFFDAEIALTRKENEERNARNKTKSDIEKRPQKPQSREDRLSRHIVESWTKLDRAKWKKEKRHNTKETDITEDAD